MEWSWRWRADGGERERDFAHSRRTSVLLLLLGGCEMMMIKIGIESERAGSFLVFDWLRRGILSTTLYRSKERVKSRERGVLFAL
jgi:hypothetical protein